MWRVPERVVHRPGSGRVRLPAVALLAAYAVLLLCLPSRLVVGAVGAPGAPASLVGLLALVWWGCAALGGHPPMRAANPVRVAVALLTASVMASYANGMATGWWAPPGVRQTTDDVYSLVSPGVVEVTSAMITAADRGLLSYAGWIGVALLCLDGVRSWHDLDRLVAVLTWAGAAVAVLGIVQFFTGLDVAGLFQVPGLHVNAEFGAVSSRSILNRPSSTATHPIEFGVVLAVVFPLALHRMIHRWGHGLAWLPTAVIGVAVVMSVSRSAVLVLVVALVVMGAGWPAAWRRRALVVGPVSLVALRLVVPGLVGTVLSLFRNAGNDPSITGRTDDYAVVLRLFGEHPVLGRGMFTFQPRYYRILDNQYLTAMLELGYVGLVALVALVLVGYGCARGARLRTASPRDRHLCLALSGSVLGMGTGYLTFDAWSFPMAAGSSFLLLGMAGAAWRLSRLDGRAADPPAASPGRSAPAAASVEP